MNMHDPQTPKKFGLITKFLIAITGADEELLRQCPQHDVDNVRAIGVLMIATFLYQTGLFAMICNRLFAAPGQFRPELVLVAAALAGFIMAIDSYIIMRAGWHQNGLNEIGRGGLDISGGITGRVKAGVSLAVRVILSIGIAQLTAVFVSLIVFGADIDAEVRARYEQANAHLIAEAATLVDASIQRATDAVAAESKRDADLAVQVAKVRDNDIDPSANDPQVQQAQDEVAKLAAQQAKADEAVQAAEKFASDEMSGVAGPGHSGQAGKGIRRRAAMEQVSNAKAHLDDVNRAATAAHDRLDAIRKQLASSNEVTRQRSHDQLPAFERQLADENAKLVALKDQLAALIKGRADAIRDAVEHAPDHVRPSDGLLAQITALEHVARSDSKIGAVIILIDVVSFGFELASVLAKVTSFVPTTYAALLASRAYLSSVRIVDDMMRELDDDDARQPKRPTSPPSLTVIEGGKSEPATPKEADKPGTRGPFDPPDDDPSPPPSPPKRKRGRPRKGTIH